MIEGTSEVLEIDEPEPECDYDLSAVPKNHEGEPFDLAFDAEDYYDFEVYEKDYVLV